MPEGVSRMSYSPGGRSQEPPCASDGADLYIRKLLAPVSGDEPRESGDTFFSSLGAEKEEKEERHRALLNTVIKGAGLVFAVTLGILGIRHFSGPRSGLK